MLSFTGGYRLTMSGNSLPTGLAFEDTFVWQPRHGICFPFRTAAGKNSYRMDKLGFLYFPLIRLDQMLLHRSRPYLTLTDNDPDKTTIHPWPPLEQMHPTARKMIVAIDAAKARHQTALDTAQARGDYAEVSRLNRQIRDEAEKEFATQP